ncbi:MAG: TIGR00730 family Rossman fold protein [Acidobacteria bacterium]|nr:TIGR00730 family Rossman fold protein [Acidobacteriota bacterium]
MKRPKELDQAPLAHLNPEFMGSGATRPLRILAEYLDPRVRLRQQGVADTIVIFGSARMISREQAEARLRRAMKGRASKEKRDRVREARAALGMSRYYEEARALARRITDWSLELGPRPRRFVVCSGGGPGIMEAANRGAYEAGGKSIGLGIQLPHEQRPNPYISPELNFNFHYFFMRKLWFSQLAKALVVFPGGYGTLDELWEMLTLMQTGKMTRNNLILIYGRKYWDEILNWRAMVRYGMVNEEDYKLLQFADTVEDAFARVRENMERYHMKVDGDWGA